MAEGKIEDYTVSRRELKNHLSKLAVDKRIKNIYLIEQQQQDFFMEGIDGQFIKDAGRDLQIHNEFFICNAQRNDKPLNLSSIIKNKLDKHIKNDYLVHAVMLAHSQDATRFVTQLMEGSTYQKDEMPKYIFTSSNYSMNRFNYLLKSNKVYYECNFSPIPIVEHAIQPHPICYTEPVLLNYVLKEPDLYVVTEADIKKHSETLHSRNAILAVLQQKSAIIYIIHNFKLISLNFNISLNPEQVQLLTNNKQFKLNEIDDRTLIAIRNIIYKVICEKNVPNLFGLQLENIVTKDTLIQLLAWDTGWNDLLLNLQQINLKGVSNPNDIEIIFTGLLNNALEYHQNLEFAYDDALTSFNSKYGNLKDTLKNEEFNQLLGNIPIQIKRKFLAESIFLQFFNTILDNKNLLLEAIDHAEVLNKAYREKAFFDLFNEDGTCKNPDVVALNGVRVTLASYNLTHYNLRDMVIITAVIAQAHFQLITHFEETVKQLIQAVENAPTPEKPKKNSELIQFNDVLQCTPTHVLLEYGQTSIFEKKMKKISSYFAPVKIKPILSIKDNKLSDNKLNIILTESKEKVPLSQKTKLTQEATLAKKLVEDEQKQLRVKVQKENELIAQTIAKARLDELNSLTDLNNIEKHLPASGYARVEFIKAITNFAENTLSHKGSIKPNNQDILEVTKQFISNNAIEIDELTFLTRLVNAGSSLVNNQSSASAQGRFAQALIDLPGHRNWTKIIIATALIALSISILVFSITLAIHTAGISTPLSGLGIKAAVDGFLITGAVLGIGSGVTTTLGLGFFAYSGRKHGLAEAFEDFEVGLMIK